MHCKCLLNQGQRFCFRLQVPVVIKERGARRRNGSFGMFVDKQRWPETLVTRSHPEERMIICHATLQPLYDSEQREGNLADVLQNHPVLARKSGQISALWAKQISLLPHGALVSMPPTYTRKVWRCRILMGLNVRSLEPLLALHVPDSVLLVRRQRSPETSENTAITRPHKVTRDLHSLSWLL